MQVLKLGSDEVKADSEGWLVLDGAHTAQSAAALATTVRQVFPDNPIALIVAMADDKDHKAVMAALRGGVRPALVIFTTVDIAGSSNRYNTVQYHWQFLFQKHHVGPSRFGVRIECQKCSCGFAQLAEG